MSLTGLPEPGEQRTHDRRVHSRRAEDFPISSMEVMELKLQVESMSNNIQHIRMKMAEGDKRMELLEELVKIDHDELMRRSGIFDRVVSIDKSLEMKLNRMDDKIDIMMAEVNKSKGSWATLVAVAAILGSIYAYVSGFFGE